LVTVPRIDSPDDRRTLLRIARATVAERIGVCGSTAPSDAGAPGNGAVLDEGSAPGDGAVPGRFGGAFVTLWLDGRLRGCVGTFEETDDIARTVRDAAAAALRDSRFAATPMTAAELERVVFEVSVLSALEATTDPLSLVPGTHGVVIRAGNRSGCFLPKVAAERGWSAEELLSNCCTMKAGLPADAWRGADAQVSLFTAVVFSEASPDDHNQPADG
jgi:hypothetical protein